MMERFKVTTNFYLDEFVDVKTYVDYAKRGRLYKLAYKFRGTFKMAQLVRDEMNEPAIINNWWETYLAFNHNVTLTYNKVEMENSLRQWSGIRMPNTPYYTKDSLHSTFGAVDMLFGSRGWLDKFYAIVRTHWKELGIAAMETNNSWGHIDQRFIPNQTSLFEFSA